MRLLLVLLMLLCGSASASAAPALWEVRDDDSRVVLFGSVHALPADVEWRTPLLDDAMDAAPLVYFETDIGPLGLAAMAIKIVVQQFQQMGEPWLDRLTSEQLDKLIVAIEPLGITLEAAAVTPPWALAMELTDFAMRGADGAIEMDMAMGVESVLQWELAKERKGYLETPGEQFDMIAGGTIEQQIEQLMMTIDESGADGVQMLAQIVDDWEAGNVDGLVMAPKNEGEKAMLDLLLVQRNRNWLPKIEAMLAEDSENLVVVGAGHLAGDDSVLDLLAKAGYTVTRIQ